MCQQEPVVCGDKVLFFFLDTNDDAPFFFGYTNDDATFPFFWGKYGQKTLVSSIKIFDKIAIFETTI